MKQLMVFHEQKSPLIISSDEPTEIYIFSEQEVAESLAQKVRFSVDFTQINQVVQRIEIEDL